MNKLNGGKSLPYLSVFLLFVIFAICILIVLIGGGNIYQEILKAQDDHYEQYTAVQYIATKIRQADYAGGITIKEFSGNEALVINETIADKDYETYIYCQDGYLYELFVEKGYAQNADDGEKIISAIDFQADFDKENTQMLKLQLQTDENTTQEITLYLHSDKETK